MVPTGLVVLTFLVAIVAGRLQGRTINDDLDGIVRDAIPSVVLLSAARSDLHHLDASVGAYANSALAGMVAAPVASLDLPRQSIGAALDRYHELPSFAGEQEHDALLPARLAAIDAAVARVLAAVDARSPAAVDAHSPAAVDARSPVAVDARSPVAVDAAVRDEQHAAEDLDALLEGWSISTRAGAKDSACRFRACKRRANRHSDHPLGHRGLPVARHDGPRRAGATAVRAGPRRSEGRSVGLCGSSCA